MPTDAPSIEDMLACMRVLRAIEADRGAGASPQAAALRVVLRGLACCQIERVHQVRIASAALRGGGVQDVVPEVQQTVEKFLDSHKAPK